MASLLTWTVADYHRMIEAGILSDRPVELLAGEIYEMTPEGPPHSFYGGSLADYFRDCLGKRALVREARPITLTNSEPEPDIAIVRGTWADYRYRHPGPEEIFLVLEVSESSLAKDLEQKTCIYATAKIPEYWVLDIAAQRLIVFRNPVGVGYQSRQEFQTGTISPLAFPEMTISLSQLFRA